MQATAIWLVINSDSGRTGLMAAIVKGFAALALVTLGLGTLSSATPVPQFERDVLPILTAKCAACHAGPQAAQQLDLQTGAFLLRGSKNGRVVIQGSAEQSKLFQKIKARQMPPPGAGTLTDEEIRIIGEWIDGGAQVSEAAKPVERVSAAASKPVSSGAPPDYERDVQPIFTKHCVACHSGSQAKAALDLSSLASFLSGSTNGPVAVKGASEKSFLIRKVRKQEMPPPGAGQPLSEAEIVTIARWIDLAMPETATEKPKGETAAIPAPTISDKDRQFWSFVKPKRPPVPKVKNSQRVRTPIDVFILAKLEPKGLNFSPEASSLALMRRAYFDLTGLPPSPEQVRAYMADKKPDAYERLVDELLASPRYGERWGRYWLDVAGYADTKSIDNYQAVKYVFPNIGIWRYRDYVIRSFQEDKPYDRFLTEQLAGDELVDWRNARRYTPEIRDALAGTGYLRNVIDNRGYDAIFEAMDTVSSGLMGLTVGCARCHSHKYDPIPQQDYYRIAANFAPVYMYAEDPKEDLLPDASKAELEEIARYNSEIDPQLEDLTHQLESIRGPHEKKLFQARLASVTPQVRSDLTAALELDVKKRSPVQIYLVQKFGDEVRVPAQEVDASLTEAERSTCARLQKQIDGL